MFKKGTLRITSSKVEIIGEDGKSYYVFQDDSFQRKYPVRYQGQEGVPEIYGTTWNRIGKVTVNGVEIPNGAVIEFDYR